MLARPHFTHFMKHRGSANGRWRHDSSWHNQLWVRRSKREKIWSSRNYIPCFI